MSNRPKIKTNGKGIATPPPGPLTPDVYARAGGVIPAGSGITSTGIDVAPHVADASGQPVLVFTVYAETNHGQQPMQPVMFCPGDGTEADYAWWINSVIDSVSQFGPLMQQAPPPAPPEPETTPDVRCQGCGVRIFGECVTAGRCKDCGQP